jgi:hypothetical protein
MTRVRGLRPNSRSLEELKMFEGFEMFEEFERFEEFEMV